MLRLTESGLQRHFCINGLSVIPDLLHHETKRLNRPVEKAIRKFVESEN